MPIQMLSEVSGAGSQAMAPPARPHRADYSWCDQVRTSHRMANRRNLQQCARRESEGGKPADAHSLLADSLAAGGLRRTHRGKTGFYVAEHCRRCALSRSWRGSCAAQNHGRMAG